MEGNFGRTQGELFYGIDGSFGRTRLEFVFQDKSC